jgi:thioesterase domain-containing protein
VDERTLEEVRREVADIVKADDLQADTDLVESGVSSVEMVRIGNRLGLSTSAVFEARTVRKLAAAAAAGPAARPAGDPALVTLEAGDGTGAAPLFLVHDLSGDLACYVELARHLGHARPIYGFQPLGLDGADYPRTRLEDMAAAYLRALRAVQPRGPYLLGGMCFGGAVAFEMAQQLRADGESADLLALIDTPCPPFSPEYGRRFNRTRYAWHLRRAWNRIKERSAPIRVGRGGQAGSWREIFRRLRVDRANQHAVAVYEPRSYAGRITLFLAGEAFVDVSPDPRRAWEAHAGGGLDVHVVDGPHQALLTEPNAGVVAGKLNELLGAPDGSGRRRA